MIRVEEHGKVSWRCAFCGTGYTSTAAARACEDAHLDERREMRKERSAHVRGD